jgi:hypothetical protein
LSESFSIDKIYNPVISSEQLNNSVTIPVYLIQYGSPVVKTVREVQKVKLKKSIKKEEKEIPHHWPI